MNNKKKGSDFEKKLCEILAKDGYWVHFMSPNNKGAQPFDIIAVRNGHAIAGDCKTCESHIFRLSRAEDNQILSFEKWVACGNGDPYFFVEHDGKVYFIRYWEMKKHGKVDLDKRVEQCILESETK